MRKLPPTAAGNSQLQQRQLRLTKNSAAETTPTPSDRINQLQAASASEGVTMSGRASGDYRHKDTVSIS